MTTVCALSSSCSGDSNSNPGSGGAAGASSAATSGGTTGTTTHGGGGGTGTTSTGTGGSGTGGSGTGGSGAGESDADAGVAAAPLPRLHVEGNQIKTEGGKVIILRGSSLMDIGTLFSWGKSATLAKNIPDRIDTLGTAGIAGHVVRFPVYPRTNVNQTFPYYSPLPYPIGPAAPASAKVTYEITNFTIDQYVTTILRKAVDYAKRKGMYAIIDYHQIDDTSGQSGIDAKTFWTQVAPLFKDDTNVIFEAFNEPIDIGPSSPAERWKAYKPVAQGWVDAIRAGAPDNLIIVGSPSWCQTLAPAATDPIVGTNLVYSAHIYPGNWNSFKSQFDAAVAAHPIAVTEWGYSATGDKNLIATSPTWGSELRTYLDSTGASWTAWVADDSWTPSLFKSNTAGTLTEFGTLTRDWLAAKNNSDWIE